MQFGIQQKEFNVAAVRDGEIGPAILERSRRRPRRQFAPISRNIVPRKPLRYNELTKPPQTYVIATLEKRAGVGTHQGKVVPAKGRPSIYYVELAISAR